MKNPWGRNIIVVVDHLTGQMIVKQEKKMVTKESFKSWMKEDDATDGILPNVVRFESHNGRVDILVKVPYQGEYKEARIPVSFEEIDDLCEYLGETQDDRNE